MTLYAHLLESQPGQRFRMALGLLCSTKLLREKMRERESSGNPGDFPGAGNLVGQPDLQPVPRPKPSHQGPKTNKIKS